MATITDVHLRDASLNSGVSWMGGAFFGGSFPDPGAASASASASARRPDLPPDAAADGSLVGVAASRRRLSSARAASWLAAMLLSSTKADGALSVAGAAGAAGAAAKRTASAGAAAGAADATAITDAAFLALADAAAVVAETLFAAAVAVVAAVFALDAPALVFHAGSSTFTGVSAGASAISFLRVPNFATAAATAWAPIFCFGPTMASSSAASAAPAAPAASAAPATPAVVDLARAARALADVCVEASRPIPGTAARDHVDASEGVPLVARHACRTTAAAVL